MAVHYKGPDQRYAYTNVTVQTENGPSITTKYIGIVLNREKKIYRKNGEIFYYDDETDSYQKVTEKFDAIDYEDNRTRSEPSSVFFGASFALYNFLAIHDLLPLLESLECPGKETFIALIFFYLLSDWPGYEAKNWYEADVLRYFYPKADMSDSSLSTLLQLLGNSAFKFDFLKHWAKVLQTRYKEKDVILIDTPGLDHKIKSRFSACWNHNEEARHGARLLLAFLKESEIPIFYEFIEESIVEKSILQETILCLEQAGCKIEECLFDTGFTTGSDIDLFYDQDHKLRLDYIMHISKEDKVYKHLLMEEADKIKDNMDCQVNCDNRTYFIQGFSIQAGPLQDNPAWLYLCLDVAARETKLQELAQSQKEGSLSNEQLAKKRKRAGWFGLLSGSRRDKEELLAVYQQHQQLEQNLDFSRMFDRSLFFDKPDKEIIQGCFLLFFIVFSIERLLEQAFKKAHLSPGARIKAMCTQMALVYPSRITIHPPQEENALIYRQVLEIFCPVSLPLHDGVISYIPPGLPKKRKRKKKPEKKEIQPKRKRGRPRGAKNKKTLEQEARKAQENNRINDNPAESKNKPSSQKEELSSGKRRGRPPGAKNRTPEERAAIKAAKVPKKRGRPSGAKNKKTLEREAKERELARQNSKPRRGRKPGSKNKTPEQRAALQAEKEKRSRAKSEKVESRKEKGSESEKA